MEEEENRLRLAVIAGAAKAARFKEENPNAPEDKVIQYVTENAQDILSKIDEDL
jgi:hypothetical protein